MEAFHELKVNCPYEILEIRDIKISNKPNEHGHLYLKVLVDENVNFKYAIEASTDDKICIYEETENQEKNIIFNGTIQNIKTSNVNRLYYMEIEALTSSFSLDIQEKSRSFQDTGMSYDNLINTILADYKIYSFTQCMDRPRSIERPLFQYKETDYEFLKRVASYLGLQLICDTINLDNVFYFGTPSDKYYKLEEDIDYTASIDIKKYRQLSASTADIHPTDFFYYIIKSKKVMDIGATVNFKGKELYVNSYEAEYIRGDLVFTYKLCRKKGIWQEKLYNEKLKGISLEGEVLEVLGEQVKLHLNIDKTQDQSKAVWFRYAPPTGNIMYSMPIVGTSANLYFPNERNEEPIVIGCVRKNGSSCEKFSDVNNRYFATESGNNLDLLPGAINITRPGLSATFNDGGGINLNSSSTLSLNAGYVGLFAGDITIHGKSKVVAQKGGSFISLENDFYNDAGIVMENGSDRASNSNFTDDDPQNGVAEAKAALEAQMNEAALVAASEGAAPVIGNMSDGSTIGPMSDSSIPLEGKELENRADVPYFDPDQVYPEGTPVKIKSLDGEYILGTTSKLIDPERGSISDFTPCDPDSYSEHNSRINSLKSIGLAGVDFGQKGLWEGAKAVSYVEQFGDYALSKIGLTNYSEDSYELARQRCDEISASWSDYLYSIAPHKGVFKQSETVMNIAAIIDGVHGGFSAFKNIKNAFKIGKSLKDGIKLSGSFELAADGAQVMSTSLQGIGSIIAEGGRTFEAGTGIYNISGDSNHSDGSDNNDINSENKLLDWKEFQHANKGKFKTDEDGLAKDKMVDAWEEYKKEHYPNQGEHYLHRPNIRKETKDGIKYTTKEIVDESTGEVLEVRVDPNNRDIVLKKGEIDIGHKTDHEYARCRDAAESLGWNQSQFNEFMNNPEFYQWEDHASNISHAYENKSKDLEDIIEEMIEFQNNKFKW